MHPVNLIHCIAVSSTTVIVPGTLEKSTLYIRKVTKEEKKQLKEAIKEGYAKFQYVYQQDEIDKIFIKD